MGNVSGDVQRNAIRLCMEMLRDVGIEARISPIYLGYGEVHAMIVLPDVQMAVVELDGVRGYAVVETVGSR